MIKRSIKKSEHRRLKDYYQDLAVLERSPLNHPLVAPWRASDMKAITAELRTAFAACLFPANPIRVGDMCPQAIGNAVATLMFTGLKQHLDGFTLDECPGPGYPDFKLVHLATRRTYPLEIKATGKKHATDSRVVLTSASTKLRHQFEPPVRHLIATTQYLRMGSYIRIEGLRLNFLGPRTPVHVRFEVAVTSRLLHQDYGAVWISGDSEPPASCAVKATGNTIVPVS